MFLWVFGFGFSGRKVMNMVYEHKKNRVSVSAMISLTGKQTTGSVQLAATAEKGTFDSGLADYMSYCGNNMQSLWKL